MITWYQEYGTQNQENGITRLASIFCTLSSPRARNPAGKTHSVACDEYHYSTWQKWSAIPLLLLLLQRTLTRSPACWTLNFSPVPMEKRSMLCSSICAKFYNTVFEHHTRSLFRSYTTEVTLWDKLPSLSLACSTQTATPSRLLLSLL